MRALIEESERRVSRAVRAADSKGGIHVHVRDDVAAVADDPVGAESATVVEDLRSECGSQTADARHVEEAWGLKNQLENEIGEKPGKPGGSKKENERYGDGSGGEDSNLHVHVEVLGSRLMSGTTEATSDSRISKNRISKNRISKKRVDVGSVTLDWAPTGGEDVEDVSLSQFIGDVASNFRKMIRKIETDANENRMLRKEVYFLFFVVVNESWIRSEWGVLMLAHSNPLTLTLSL